jgi:hypothetical protein
MTLRVVEMRDLAVSRIEVHAGDHAPAQTAAIRASHPES